MADIRMIVCCIQHYLLNIFLLPEAFALAECPTGFDFITPQAFGRNSFPENSRWFRFWNWWNGRQGGIIALDVGIVRTIRDSSSSDVEAFERLKEMNFDSGQPNESLANLCLTLLLRRAVPMIGQWEVHYALWKQFPAWYRKHQGVFTVIWPLQNRYLGTHGMLLEVRRIAHERGLLTPCVVAHPGQIQRAYFVARKIFGVRIAFATDFLSNEWFDAESVQQWTRGKWRWIVYDMLARVHHRLHGWM